ncbi:tyrosine-type recombinase/integrase [Flavobacterium sp. JP2137]|uniref:tyrosine-type recombinase/integrase n=1 Tax=Flavobacterium sp. JP2137 TaxID=3414510 RepID=UPI003D2FA18F
MLNILFLLQKNRTNKSGKCPVRCRLTYHKNRKEFSSGLFINPEYWINSKQKAHPPNEENNFINSQISLIKNNINQAFLLLQLQKVDFNVEHIYKQYKGETQNEDKSLMDAFEYHNSRMKKLVGIETSINSWERYNNTQNHICDFMWFRFNKKDILLKELTFNFITDFEYYLKTEKKYMPTTIFKSIQRFRRVVRVAESIDYIVKDPFMLYKAKKPKKEIIYLTQPELCKLENFNFSQNRLASIRDMFVFCCYTGLAYNEMYELEDKHLVTGFDGNRWVKMTRKKTNKEISIPLLPKALQIISEQEHKNGSKVFPKISNQKFNSYLKEIAFLLGFEKNLTHHIARKTFATTVLLYNDVPMEIVSELLGHSKISMTQEHYGKIVQSKISEHIEKLSIKLKNK